MGHKLDDNLLVTVALQERLQWEANNLRPDIKVNAAWWVGLERNNGAFHHFSAGYTADAGEIIVAEHLIKALNKEIHHDGAWIVQWCLAGRHLNAIWIDRDGDIQFTVEFDEDACGMAETKLGHWVEQCQQAFQYWHHMMIDALAPSPDQLFKRAKGQANPSICKGILDPNNEYFNIAL